MKLRDQIHALKVQQYSFDILVLEAEMKLKFPCTFFLTWKVDRQTFKKNQNIPPVDNKIIFNASFVIGTEMTYNSLTKQHLEKKLQICINLNSLTRENSTNLAGVVTIDLSKCINNTQMQKLKIYKIQRCPDKSSTLKLSIKCKFVRQVRIVDINQSLAEIRTNSIHNTSLMSSRVSQKMNNNLQISLNISNECLLRSPSLKIQYSNVKQQPKQQQDQNIINNNGMNRQLRQVQSMKYFYQKQKVSKKLLSKNQLIKSAYNLDVSQTQDQKNTIKCTKDQINDFHEELLKEINRVKIQEQIALMNNNIRSSRKQSPQFPKLIKDQNVKMTLKNQNQKQLQLELKEQKQKNETLRKDLNKAENQLIYLRYSNSEAKFKINQKQMLIKMLKQNLQHDGSSIQYQKQISVLKQEITQFEKRINQFIQQRSQIQNLANRDYEIKRLKIQLQEYCQENKQLTENLKEYEKLFHQSTEDLRKTNILNKKKDGEIIKKIEQIKKMEQRLKSKEDQKENNEEQLRQKYGLLKKFEQKIIILNQQLVQKNQNLNSLQTKNKQKSIIIEQITEMNNSLLKQREQRIYKDSNIMAQMKKLQKQIQALNSQIIQQKQINEQLQYIVAINTEKQNELKTNLAIFQNQIIKLNELLTQKQKMINYYKSNSNNNKILQNDNYQMYSIQEKEEHSEQSNLQQVSRFDETLNESNISLRKKDIEEMRQINTNLIKQNTNLNQELKKYYQKIEKISQMNLKYQMHINEMETSKKILQPKLYNEIKQLKQEKHKNQKIVQLISRNNIKSPKEVWPNIGDLEKKNQQLYDFNLLQTIQRYQSCDLKMFQQSKILCKDQKLQNNVKLIIQLLKLTFNQMLVQNQSSKSVQKLKYSNISSNSNQKFKEILKTQIKQLSKELQKSKLRFLNSFVSIFHKKIIIQNLRIIQVKIQSILQLLMLSSK